MTEPTERFTLDGQPIDIPVRLAIYIRRQDAGIDGQLRQLTAALERIEELENALKDVQTILRPWSESMEPTVPFEEWASAVDRVEAALAASPDKRQDQP